MRPTGNGRRVLGSKRPGRGESGRVGRRGRACRGRAGTHWLAFGSSGPRSPLGSFHAGASWGPVVALIPLQRGHASATAGGAPGNALGPEPGQRHEGWGAAGRAGGWLGGRGPAGGTCLASFGPAVSWGAPASRAAGISLEKWRNQPHTLRRRPQDPHGCAGEGRSPGGPGGWGWAAGSPPSVSVPPTPLLLQPLRRHC